MSFEFQETQNQEKFHNDPSIKYISQITYDADSSALLDIIIGAFKINKENRRDYFLKIKQYYINKGVSFDEDFEEYLDNFLEVKWSNAKGAFLEILTYKLIESYCGDGELLKECIVKYNGEPGIHPYDIIKTENNKILLMDVKFSTTFLENKHLKYLLKYLTKPTVIPYLLTLDYKERMEMKIRLIEDENQIQNNAYLNSINLISRDEYYNSILQKTCIINQ